ELCPIPLETLIARVRTTSQPSLAGIEFREKLAYTGAIPCAEPLMQQVLANLLENAAHAAGRGGWVEVRSALDNGTSPRRLVLEVQDSGAGIPPELRDRIFEPFFTTKPPGAGTGLGLATAREIVASHGGTLALCESPNGALFRIEMPLEAG